SVMLSCFGSSTEYVSEELSYVLVVWEQVLRDRAGIHCRSCQYACEPAAIRFRPALGGVALAVLDSQRCNCCGACLAPCPSQAIQLRALSNEESPRHA
ncbi:hypothetical protein ACLI36_13485, partial [Pseudomonas aeruginosa]